jgi:hypothetical protein
VSKKTNTLLFILAATAFNIIVTVICFTALLFCYARFLAPRIPGEGQAWGFPVIFIAAIALSFVIYRLVLKQLLKKVNVEKYFDPVFGGRRPPTRNDQ